MTQKIPNPTAHSDFANLYDNAQKLQNPAAITKPSKTLTTPNFTSHDPSGATFQSLVSEQKNGIKKKKKVTV
jgi:hypothetical protein